MKRYIGSVSISAARWVMREVSDVAEMEIVGRISLGGSG
jgi:hypothetical protein